MAEDVILDNKKSSRYRLAAALVKKRTVLGYGVNSYCKTHPLQATHKKNDMADFPCAEVSAIANAKRRWGEEELKGATIYVARVKYTDSLKTKKVTGLAYPCSGCAKHIRQLGIARIVYTLDVSGFNCEEVQ